MSGNQVDPRFTFTGKGGRNGKLIFFTYQV